MKPLPLPSAHALPSGRWFSWLTATLLTLGPLLIAPPLLAQDAVTLGFANTQRLANGDVALTLTNPPPTTVGVEISSDLTRWQPWIVARGSGTNRLTDTGAATVPSRFYRARSSDDATALTGDVFPTDDGSLVVHPINHASVVLAWNGRTIYVDPVGGASPYRGLAPADLILVTHGHGDHFDAPTLSAVRSVEGRILAPAAVYTTLSATLKANAIPLANGQSTNLLGFGIEAIPAYNGNHPKGVGNGYIVTLGGRRFYFSGDTGDIPEMKALTGIEAAFVCMNQPFTMTIAQAAGAVKAFQPKVVYPYHYRNSDGSLSDLTAFRRQLGADTTIEVRPRKWY